MSRARDIADLVDANGDIVAGALGNAEVVDDTSPQLGADLDVNGQAIVSVSNGNIALTPDGTGEVDVSKIDVDAGTIDGTTIGGSSAAAGTFTTLSATTLGSAVDLNNQALTNADINSGAIDGVTLGTSSAVTEAQIDNININGNTISSTDTNGNVTIDPNGTGNVLLGNLTFDADQTVGAGQDNYVLTYDNSAGTIGLEAATGGGGGISDVVDDLTPQLGGPLDVNGQAIVSVSNGNIALTPDGTGEVDISKVDIDAGAIDGTTIGANSAAAGTFTTLSATTLGSAVDLNNQALTNADINSGAIDGTTIGAASAAAGTFTTLSATTLGSAVDLNNQALTNADIDSGAIDGVTLGTNSAVTEAQIDNININGNTVSSTNTDGDITLDPNGTGHVVIPADIGIGTTSPQSRIHIEDSSPTIRLEDTGANGYVQLTANNTRGGLTISLDPDNVDSDTDLRVFVDGSEVARFDASGLSFDTGSNHLNDYEEGTWTLTPETNSGTAASIGTASGIYTRVGRLVTVTGTATNITPGGTAGSIFRIGGLPFTPANENSNGSASWDSISFQGSSTRFYFAPQARIAGYIQFIQCGENNADTALDHGDLDAGGTSDIQFTVTYMV